jgi:mono/diheme cytochrome c family protein
VITWKGPLPIGDPAKGYLLVIADKCGSCHGENLGGRGFYRNITPDVETGIGSWTDRQIANAIRGGGGPGTQFCSLMPLYSGLKDRQIADMVAYLRSVPAISNQIVSMCPGHYPPGAR